MLRVNAVLREDIVAALDEIAHEEHTNRSGLLREAAERFIADYRKRREEELRRQRRAHSVAVQDRLRSKADDWDGVAEIRKWRESA